MPRILVIEDNAQQRDVYSTLLHNNGFDIQQAATAEAGIAAAHETIPDLILIDVRLPGMDGVTATRLLKDTPETAKIPIICITGFDVAEKVVRGAGADDFLRKPLASDVLVRAVRKFVRPQPSATRAVGSRRALLIAGKDSTATVSLVKVLEAEGYQISRAADGATGLGVASAIKPDVILVDLHAPVLDGWQVLQRMKAEDALAAIPTIAIADAPTDEERTRALDKGFAACLSFADKDGLTEVLRRFAGKASEFSH
jgi:two-component system cell cycle response regulator DivK